MRPRAIIFPLLTAACAKLAGLDGLTIGDKDNPAQPGEPRDASSDEEAVLDPSDTGTVDPVPDAGPCLQPTNDRFGVLDPRWVLRGVAVRGAAGLQLTPETGYAVGQVYWDEALTFDRFEVTFKFTIATTAASRVGDGIVFSWLEGAQMSPLGDAGAHHGVFGKKGFAVVIDTYKNADDPVVPDVSVRPTLTFIRIAASPVLPTLTDGKEHELKAKLVGNELTVTVDGVQAFAAPLPGYVPYVGYASFSAGTGGAKSTHTLTEATLRIGSRGPCAAP